MTPTIITFEVLGKPQHQGSMRAFTPKGWKRPILTTTNKELKPWRQEVAACAERAMRDLDIKGCLDSDVAIRVEAHFYFTRPKSTKKDAHHKLTKPDIDKLARALLDSMCGTVYGDDSQVSQLWVSKFLASSAKTWVRVTTMAGTGWRGPYETT